MKLTRTLALALASIATFSCADLTAPATTIRTRPAAGSPPAPAPKPAEPSAEAEPAAQVGARNEVAASHILVSYKGALRAKPDVTRTKEEARKRAEAILAALKKGGDFAEIAKKESDGPSSVRGGALGKFTRERMVKPFADAAFSLKPGQLSDVVETKFGFHVIKRTE